MALKFTLVLIFFSFCNVNCSYEKEKRNKAIDSSYLEEVLDAQECDRQLEIIRGNAMLLLQFADAGLRTPRGILTGNTIDFGNYHQCLGIHHQQDEMHIQGKYCSIDVPFNQNLQLPSSQYMQGSYFHPSSLRLDNKTISKIEEYNTRRRKITALSGELNGFRDHSRNVPGNPLDSAVFTLGLCVPKPCTTGQVINSLLHVSEIGFEYKGNYCRLPDDKPWVTADYVAIAVFSILGLLTLVSSFYDIWNRFILKTDVKQMSVLYRSFSVYTNGQALTTYSSHKLGNIRCLDGIRTLATIWVLVGHTFSTEPFIENRLDSLTWTISAEALWVTTGTMTVDTFFTLAGLLVVYTTAGKMKQMTFIKNLHWFYLNRFMRVTPMLALAVLLQASFFNRMADGPYWWTVASQTDMCRSNWWSTVLHVQNIVHNNQMCFGHSWYIAIDFQLYVLSPILLYWVYSGNKRFAWTSLLGGLAAVLAASTIYCFIMDLPAGVIVPSRVDFNWVNYYVYYYYNTLARASPYFVGLVFGYLLHIYREKKMHIPWNLVIFFWACFTGILGGILYFKYRIKQLDWDNNFADNFMNSFMRPSYACAICWLIIACVHGYAGPVDWFLSLDIWRLPSRLTYGIYLFHYPLMSIVNGAVLSPIYFTVGRLVFKFLSYMVLSVVISFIFTLLVDSPIAVLFKMLMESAKSRSSAVTEKKQST